MEEKLINIAKSLLGRPYKYGAQISEAPKYFDCSLFIQYVFGKIRIKLPRTAIEQAMVGKKVAINKIKEGDVIFLKGEIGRYNKYFPQGIGHAGIYIGDNKVIHASSRRLGNELKNIYNSKLIKEKGGVVITDLKKFIKRGEPLIIIKRYF
ncbi:C40 family peptidase [Candidatus Giovannonibacteria bacterium]|nr:C40 family peptidase [Candidatus Giovannonibacteria bacterium]